MRAALIQMRGDRARDENLDRAEELLKEAARAGAEVACLQELFATWFFAQTLDPRNQELAEPTKRWVHRASESRTTLSVLPQPHAPKPDSAPLGWPLDTFP